MAFPPLRRDDFLSRGQFRMLVKHTCVSALAAPLLSFPARSLTRPAPFAAPLLPPRRRLDYLEPELSPQQRKMLMAVLVRLWSPGRALRRPLPPTPGAHAPPSLPPPCQSKRRTSLVAVWGVLPHVVGACAFVEAVQRAHWRLQLEMTDGAFAASCAGDRGAPQSLTCLLPPLPPRGALLQSFHAAQHCRTWILGRSRGIAFHADVGHEDGGPMLSMAVTPQRLPGNTRGKDVQNAWLGGRLPTIRRCSHRQGTGCVRHSGLCERALADLCGLRERPGGKWKKAQPMPRTPKVSGFRFGVAECPTLWMPAQGTGLRDPATRRQRARARARRGRGPGVWTVHVNPSRTTPGGGSSLQ